jgi:hypothetical protein
MSEDNMFHLFPQKRIKPYDGMEITADVWEQAHSYHRQVQQAHNLFFHGFGIVTGLEVVASDPVDQMVYIMPGVAVDSHGMTIVLSEPVAYDIGNEVEGQLYLYITHRESEQSIPANSSAEAPCYMQNEFLISARPSLPETFAVELARFNRETRSSPLKDAENTLHPKTNEIDLRYRRNIAVNADQQMTAAVVYLGKVKHKNHGRGLAYLSKEIRAIHHINLVVEDDAKFDPGILGFTMIYLVAEGNFKITDAQVKAFKEYIANNGFLFFESVDETAKSLFINLAEQLGVTLEPVTRDHPLLSQPYRFAEPVEGFDKSVELLAKDGIILSACNYGRLWFGEAAQGNPSREMIRSCMEWGVNLLTYIDNTQNG